MSGTRKNSIDALEKNNDNLDIQPAALVVTNNSEDKIQLFAHNAAIEAEEAQLRKLSELSRLQTYRNLLPDETIISPNVASDLPPNEKMIKVAELFNAGIPTEKYAYVKATSFLTGNHSLRVAPDEFTLVERNHIPQLLTYTPEYYVPNVTLNLSLDIQKLDSYSFANEFFGAHGVYVLVVPLGKYGLLENAEKILIYDSGVHVIHDPTLKINSQTNEDDNKNNHAIDLNSVRFEKKSEYHIKFHTLHIINPTAGTLVAVIADDKAYLLPFRNKPYIFNTANFQIAKQPIDGLKSFICYGNLKRLQPAFDQITVINRNGKTEFLVTDSAEPHYLYDEEATVLGFISTNQRIIDFPQKTSANTLEKNYQYYHLPNSELSLGIRLTAAYQIKNPAKVFLNFIANIEKISPDLDAQIERVVAETCFYALKEIFIRHKFTPLNEHESENAVIRDTDTQAIQDKFIQNLLPQINEALGIDIFRIQLDFQPAIIKKRKLQNTLVADNGTTLIKESGGLLIFKPTSNTNNTKDDTKQNQHNSNDAQIKAQHK